MAHTNKIPPQGDAWKKNELFLFEPRTLFLIVITSVITLAVAFFGEQGVRFMTSVLSPVPSHAPFDGTVSPIKEVPNWVKLTEAERKANFSAIPKEKLIPIPAYNPSRLALPTSSLKWNNANDDMVRNEKITYSVPYLGSYKLDGLEGSGSHPAVDIKIPEGTPIFAIANGTVIKVDNGNGGFGKHIVIQHNNVPSVEDSNTKKTYFSSYSHMSSLSVTVNQVVRKGDMIGLSGMTGTATTPHLHFQIDTDSSLWHPYWPFTSAEQRAAGLSFFDAINTGLGQGNAASKTISPLKFVQKYVGDQSLVVSSQTTAPVPTTPSPTPTPTPVQDPYDDISFVFQIPQTPVQEGANISVVVQAFDKSGKLLSWPTFKDDIALSLLNPTGTLNRTKLEAANLRTGITKLVEVQNQQVGRNKVILRFRNREFSSPEFEVLGRQSNVVNLSVQTFKQEFRLNEDVIVKITALDASGNPLGNKADFDAPVSVGMTALLGSLSQTELSKVNFGNGEALVTFKPTTSGTTEFVANYKGRESRSLLVTVLQAQHTAAPEPTPQPTTEPAPETPTPAEPTPVTEPQPVLEPEPTPTPVPETPVVEPTPPVVDTTTPRPFTDVIPSSPYFTALTELKNKGLVAGYGDGSFKPDAAVSRAEAITFILRAIDQEARDNFVTLFPDVSSDAWYAKFIATAFELGFIKGYPDGTMRPNDTVNLAEFLTMLFIGAKTDVDPNITATLPNGVKADDWFAAYVQVAVRKNIVEVDPNAAINPAEPLTRGKIGQMLYKLKVVEAQQN